MTFLDTLLSLDKAATPGPWGVGPDAIYHSNGLHDEADGYDERWLASPMADGETNPRPETWDEDTALIIALRNAAPALAAVIEAAQHAVAVCGLEGSLDKLDAALAALDKEAK